MKLHVFTLIVFSMFFFVGCGGDEIPDDEPVPCETRYDCEGSMRCIDGFCSDNCVDNTDCSFGQDCVNGDCVKKEAVSDNSNVPDEVQDEEQSDDEVEDDAGKIDETSDDDSSTETTVCKEHTDCPEDKYCYNELCISPYINKWRIGPIDLCLKDENGDGDNWDPSISFKPEPEPFVIAYLNDDEIFRTSPPDDSHCAAFQDTYDTFFIAADTLKFDVWDEDDDLDVTGGDDHVDTITFSPKVSHFRAGEMVGTGMSNMKSFSIKLVESQE